MSESQTCKNHNDNILWNMISNVSDPTADSGLNEEISVLLRDAEAAIQEKNSELKEMISFLESITGKMMIFNNSIIFDIKRIKS